MMMMNERNTLRFEHVQLDPVECHAGIETVIDEKDIPRRKTHKTTIGRNLDIGRRKPRRDVGACRCGNLVL